MFSSVYMDWQQDQMSELELRSDSLRSHDCELYTIKALGEGWDG